MSSVDGKWPMSLSSTVRSWSSSATASSREYNWDDYKGVDVKGKTLVMLVGDRLCRIPPIRGTGSKDVRR
jgi:hypothetical protein